MNDTIMDLQRAIVTALAGAIPERWERIVVNYEMLETEGGMAHDRLAFYITTGPAGDLRDVDLAIDSTVGELFARMNDELLRTAGRRWGSCDLVIDPPGRFLFRLSYEPPRRLNGVFDEESYGRFGPRYLEAYRAERASGQSTPGAPAQAHPRHPRRF